MNKVQIGRLKRRLNTLRGKIANIKLEELIHFAESCGRIRCDRGKEDNYINYLLPNSFPLSIPQHRKLFKFTVDKILDVLEEDIFLLEEMNNDL